MQGLAIVASLVDIDAWKADEAHHEALEEPTMTDILTAALNLPAATVPLTTPIVHDTDGRLLKKILAIRPALAERHTLAAADEAKAIDAAKANAAQ